MIVEKLGSTAMIIFWIYFAAMIGIGIYCRKYSTDFNGFMIGKRDLGPWYLGCAFFSTYLSSSVLIGKYLKGRSLIESTQAAMDTVVKLISLNIDNKDKYKGIPLEQYLEDL